MKSLTITRIETKWRILCETLSWHNKKSIWHRPSCSCIKEVFLAVLSFLFPLLMAALMPPLISAMTFTSFYWDIPIIGNKHYNVSVFVSGCWDRINNDSYEPLKDRVVCVPLLIGYSLFYLLLIAVTLYILYAFFRDWCLYGKHVANQPSTTYLIWLIGFYLVVFFIIPLLVLLLVIVALLVRGVFFGLHQWYAWNITGETIINEGVLFAVGFLVGMLLVVIFVCAFVQLILFTFGKDFSESYHDAEANEEKLY
jgi:hypothetical protein